MYVHVNKILFEAKKQADNISSMIADLNPQDEDDLRQIEGLKSELSAVNTVLDVASIAAKRGAYGDDDKYLKVAMFVSEVTEKKIPW